MYLVDTEDMSIIRAEHRDMSRPKSSYYFYDKSGIDSIIIEVWGIVNRPDLRVNFSYYKDDEQWMVNRKRDIFERGLDYKLSHMVGFRVPEDIYNKTVKSRLKEIN